MYTVAKVNNPLATTLVLNTLALPTLNWQQSSVSGNPQPCPISGTLGYANEGTVTTTVAASSTACSGQIAVDYDGSLAYAWDFIGDSDTYYISIPSSSPGQMGVTIGSGYTATLSWYYCGIPITPTGSCSP